MRRLSFSCRRAALILILTATLLLKGGMTAAPISLLSNGPESNRVNIAVLAEGYTADQTNLFVSDAINAVSVLLSEPPLADYSNHFNAVGLFVASAQRGSDHPVSSQFVTTYFNSTYDSLSDFIISIPPNWANGNEADGQGKVEALLEAQAPETDVTLLLVNDPTEGGSAGGGNTAIAAANYHVILAHETGHVFANLGDEYEYPNPGYPDTEEPNTTQETDRGMIKWNAWISTNTPVPTPEMGTYSEIIGLFEGAHYHSTGWYRPKLNCAMRSYGVPFCEVCSEALVLSVYDSVRPVDERTPMTTELSVTAFSPVLFSLTLIEPVDHALEVQWFTNNIEVGGATGTDLEINPTDLDDGTHTVKVVVKDPTARVRNDPEQRLQQMVMWTMNVALPWLQLDLPTRFQTGFSFRITGAAPKGFVVESSTNLTQWTSVDTNQLVDSEAWFTNSLPTETSQFHRARVILE